MIGVYLLLILSVIEAVCAQSLPLNLAHQPRASCGYNVSCSGRPAKCKGGDGGVQINVFPGVAGLQYSVDGENYITNKGFFSEKAGIYDCYAREPSGTCSDYGGKATVTEPSLVTYNFTATPPCNSLGSITFYASGGSNSYLFSIDNGGHFSTTNVFQVGPGQYQLKVQDSNNCSAANQVPTIIMPAYISAEMSGNPICGGLVSVVISATGGSGPYTYSTNGTFVANNTFTVAEVNPFIYYVKDSTGCIKSFSGTLPVSSALTAVISFVAGIACYNSGSLTVSATNGFPPYQYSLNGGNYGSSSNFSGLGTGNYTVSVRDTHGCVANSQTITITGPVALPTPIIYSTTRVPTSGGNLTIYGNFSASSEVTVDSSTGKCIFSSFSNFTTAFTCPIGAGNGGNHKVTIRVGPNECSQSVNATWSYMSPQITNASTIAGGNAVITGQNFGNGTVNPIVTIRNQTCTGCSFSPPNGVFCSFCPYAGFPTDDIIVNIAGLRSSPFPFTYIASCTTRNGFCDYQVTCYPKPVGVICGPCPNGTQQGSGNSSCRTLCGNGMCESLIGEDCVSCPQDCTEQNCGICGDLSCDGGETCSTCPKDCECASECPGECEHGGNCVNGLCQCEVPWTGPTCSSQGQPIYVSSNSTNPTVGLGSSSTNFSFSISLSSIAEVTPLGDILYSIYIPSINFSLVEEQIGENVKHNYSAQLDNGAFLSVVIWQIGQPTAISFANINTTYAANTLKLKFVISLWPFRALANSLLLTLDSLVSTQTTCVNKNSNGDDLRWVMIVVDDVSLYGQFEDKAVLDGRVQPITYSLNSNSSVVAELPHFWTTAEMDPSYSVLLKDKQAGCGQNSKKTKQTKLIIEIVVPVVVGLALIVALIIIFAPRLSLWYKLTQTNKGEELSEVSGKSNLQL